MATPPDAPYKLKQRGLPSAQMAAALAATAKLGGCTCNPDIGIREVGNGVFTSDIAHDSWCAHASQRGTKT